MLIKNEQGFGVIEAILVFVVVGIVGGAGWYVWSSNKKVSENLKVSNSQAPKGENKAQEQETVPKDDRLTYANGALAFTFKYPKDWSTKPGETDPVTKAFSATISAPNTKIDEEGYPNVVSGAEVRIYKSSDTYAKDLETYRTTGGASQFNTNVKDIVVDGEKALSYDWSYEGPPQHMIVFYKNGSQCSFAIQKDVYENPEYQKIYDSIISSIKFN